MTDEVLIDRQHFSLDAEKWTDFLTALDAPSHSHPRLERLLKEPSIFDSEEAATIEIDLLISVIER